jgi:hypothetical protein
MDHTNVSPATSVLPNSAPSPPRPHDPIAHLIIVCCHAHWIGPSGSTGSPGSPGSQGQFSHPASTDGGTNEGDNGSLRPGEDEAEWLIKEFQKGETGTFIEHVRIGLRELVKGWERWEEVVLVFSGYVSPSFPLYLHNPLVFSGVVYALCFCYQEVIQLLPVPVLSFPSHI